MTENNELKVGDIVRYSSDPDSPIGMIQSIMLGIVRVSVIWEDGTVSWIPLNDLYKLEKVDK